MSPLKDLSYQVILRRPGFQLLVNLAALAILAYSVSQWVWRGLTPPDDGVTGLPVESAPKISQDGLVAALRSTQLFGAPPADAMLSLETVPPSSLSIVLTGVLVQDNQSYAVMSVQGQPELPFAVGQEILPGVVLQAVLPDRAIIRRQNGAMESVPLKDYDKITLSDPLPVPVRRPPASVPPANITGWRSGATPHAQRENIQILQQAHIVPHPGGGLLLRDLQKGSLYERFGLRRGDVIRSVDGQAIESVEQAVRLYQQWAMAGRTPLRIEVLRAGQPMLFQFPPPTAGQAEKAQQ